MDLKTQQQRAEAFRRLHHGPGTLALPNAWDVASARILEAAGFPAIATTSAGVANSLGYPDGQQISRDEMAAVVARIAASVSVPVSADMEAGYGETEESAAETVRAAISAGAIGINLEDGRRGPARSLIDLDVQVSRVRAARAAASSAGVPIVINARTDVYLAAVGEESERLEHAILRGNAYLEAGADCVFVPGPIDRETIAALARGISGPINILAIKGVPSIAELQSLGVARVSVGSGFHRATMAYLRRAADELMSAGTYTAFTETTIPYAELNKLLIRGKG